MTSQRLWAGRLLVPGLKIPSETTEDHQLHPGLLPTPAPLHKRSLPLPTQSARYHFHQKFHQCVCNPILFPCPSPVPPPPNTHQPPLPANHLDPVQTPSFPRIYAGCILGPSRRALESMQDRGQRQTPVNSPLSISYLGWVQWLRENLGGGSWQEERSEQNLGVFQNA